MALDYIKADRYRQERLNDIAWLNGAYIARALAATVGNMFIKDKRDAIEYPSTPIPIFKNGEEDTAPQLKDSKEEQEVLFAKAYMAQMMIAGADWGKKDRGEDNACG